MQCDQRSFAARGQVEGESHGILATRRPIHPHDEALGLGVCRLHDDNRTRRASPEHVPRKAPFAKLLSSQAVRRPLERRTPGGMVRGTSQPWLRPNRPLGRWADLSPPCCCPGSAVIPRPGQSRCPPWSRTWYRSASTSTRECADRLTRATTGGSPGTFGPDAGSLAGVG